MINDILNYWYKIEYFTPCWPVDIKKDINLNKVKLPWLKEQKNEKIRLSYDLYFGKIKSIDLIKWMLAEINIPEEESIEPDNSITCIFAFKVDEEGFYIPNSFSVSSFLWAVSKIVLSGSINSELNPDDVKVFQNTIDTLIIKKQDDNKLPVDESTLNEIFSDVNCILNLPDEMSDFSLWARKKQQFRKNDGSFADVDTSTELFQSFYLNDIKNVIDNPNKKLNEYVLAGNQNENTQKRKCIDSDINEMKKWVTAERFPLGAWPSTYNPSLMQQIGINICTSGEKDIFSINGPPGTGKTTLLKEIVVSNVIERAKLLVEFDKPDQAFSVAEFKNPCDQYNRSYYCMDKRLKKYGILVASNNNAAVENISLELPKAISNDRTGRFSGQTGSNSGDIYFSDVASKLIGQPAWGLVSAKLGKKGNLNNLKERLWWAEDGITLKHYYDNPVLNWSTARDNFISALKNVLDERKRISDAQSLLDKKAVLISANTTAQNNYNQAETKLSEKQKNLDCENKKLSKLTDNFNSVNDRIDFLFSNMNLFQRLFWKFIKHNLVVNEWKTLNIKKEEIIIRISEQKGVCDKIKEDIDIISDELFDCKIKLESVKKEIDAIKKKIESERSLFQNNCADDSFWDNIEKNEKSQESCPWVYEKYNALREELFYQALQLNKSFVLTSKCVKQNLQRLFSLWDGKYTNEDSVNSYGELLNTLLLVIPVVSTTFASVESFLSNIQQEELGLLIIDEAGQATPQSALGALWRTQRAIIVGDPLQVEPVLTVPKELVKRFADEYNIPEYYRIPEISVQMLADQMNEYGGYRNINGEQIWLGCPLVVHRRCINPMFNISNQIAYENKMFLKSIGPNEDTRFVIDYSVWFDIKGKENGNKDHTVINQIDFAKKIFAKAVEDFNGFPDLFIITPFRLVAENLSRMMRKVLRRSQYIKNEKIEEWVKEHCGTVHTFQGKEANEVILVLGCDNQSGIGAAHWVGQKPNIINVAVSRAKYRIAVIGDYNLWKDIPNVQVLCKYLNKK